MISAGSCGRYHLARVIEGATAGDHVIRSMEMRKLKDAIKGLDARISDCSQLMNIQIDALSCVDEAYAIRQGMQNRPGSAQPLTPAPPTTRASMMHVDSIAPIAASPTKGSMAASAENGSGESAVARARRASMASAMRTDQGTQDMAAGLARVR